SSGYDFLSDGAAQIANTFATIFGAAGSQTLINDSWTTANLFAQLFPTAGASPGIASVNAHFDHNHALPAASNAAHTINDLFDPSQITAGRLAGRIWFSMGCHAGLNVPDVLVASPLGADWADKLAGEGAVFGANSGYGFGDTATVAYSERLMALFASHLDGSLTVGQAWMQAIQDYWSTLQTVGVYDEKVMEEATSYGLPFYGVGRAPAPIPRFAKATRSVAAAPVISPLTLDPITGLESAPFTVNPSFTLHHTAHGDFYSGDDGVMAV